MMEKAFEAADLDWRYLTFEVRPDDLATAVRGMRVMGFKGGNFTIPHKVAVIEHLDGLSEAAELMGAVNCIYRDGDKFIGENTDGKGFVQSLSEVTAPEEKRVVILGAGGAARAIAVEVGLAGAAEITIVNRTAERGQELSDLLTDKANVAARFVPWEDDYSVEDGTDILINATSIGLNDGDTRVAVDTNALRSQMVVADVIFNLVNQAVIGFKIWTGVDPSAAVMREALEEYLEL